MKTFRFYELWAYSIAYKILMRGVKRDPSCVRFLAAMHEEWLKTAEAVAMEVSCKRRDPENTFPDGPDKNDYTIHLQ